MKKLLSLLLLLPTVLFGQGTGASGVTFRIGRPVTTVAIRDSLYNRFVEATLASIRAEIRDSSRDASGDSTAVLRLFAQGVARDSSRDAAGDSARAHSADSISVLRTFVNATAGDSSRAHSADSIALLRAVDGTKKDTTSFKVDSAATKAALDSINTNLAAVSRLDTLLSANLTGDATELEPGTCAAVTRPGMFYKRTTTKNRWALADTAVTVRACGLAMDSVAAGAVCRFMIRGKFRKDTWKWTPGATLYSDSATAGEINVGGQSVPHKQQIYGEAADSNIVNVDIVKTLAY